jgi:hypothetical protein
VPVGVPRVTPEEEKAKDRDEVSLIADYEMEWGDPGNWSDEVTNEFNKKWESIQLKYGVPERCPSCGALLFYISKNEKKGYCIDESCGWRTKAYEKL